MEKTGPDLGGDIFQPEHVVEDYYYENHKTITYRFSAVIRYASDNSAHSMSLKLDQESASISCILL